MLADFGVVHALWTMIWFFLFIMWIMLVFRVFADIFRISDLSGLAKARWLIFIIFLPYLGVFAYLIARGGKMAEHEVGAARAQEDAVKTYIRDTASSASPAEELTKIAALKEQMQRLKQLEVRMNATADQQISLTDPDARSMATSGKGTGIVGYNVQTAVDAKHHLIVAHEVTNVGHDRGQLSAMARRAREPTGMEDLTVVADRGYFDGEEILACKQAGITAFVPKPLTSGAKAEGRFGKQDFSYLAPEDVYRCPAGQRLTRRFTTVEHGMTLHAYWSAQCGRAR